MNEPDPLALATLANAERLVVMGLADGKQAPGLREADLTDVPARAGFLAVQTLVRAGVDIHLIPLREQMARDGAAEHFSALANYQVVTRTDFDHALGLVRRSSRQRRVLRALWKALQETEERGMELSPEAHEQLVSGLIGRAFQGTRKGSPRMELERMEQLLDDLTTTDPQLALVQTGFHDLDRYLGGGLEPGNLIVIGARPRIGKSAFGLQLGRHIAHKGPVLFQSCEMNSREVTRRAVAQERQANSRQLTPEDVSRAIGGAVPLYLYTENNGVDDLCAVVATFQAQHPDMAAVFVDYLGLLQQGGPEANTVAEVSYISRQLKRLAERHEVPVFALHQLNREVDKRLDKRPVLSDLRDSGAIEQDANIVLLLYNAGLADGGAPSPETQCRIAKARDGTTYTVNLHWFPETVTFRSSVPSWVANRAPDPLLEGIL